MAQILPWVLLSHSSCPASGTGTTRGAGKTGGPTANGTMPSHLHGNLVPLIKFLTGKCLCQVHGTPSTHFDDTVVYSHRFHRVIQPSAWSRKRGLAGTNPLTVPIGLLTRHGASEFSLRALSEVRFLRVVTTRSIPESVFLSQLVKAIRDSGIDIDATAESLHRRRDPNAVVPSKVDSPGEFLQPFFRTLLIIFEPLLL